MFIQVLKIMEKIIQLIVLNEGFRGSPYDCGTGDPVKGKVGKITIGYGRNLQDVPLVKDEALFLLNRQLNLVINQTLDKLGFLYDKLNEARKAVLIDMAYNMGINGLLTFKNFLFALENDNFDLAAAEMIKSKWWNQVGKRAIRLRKMILTGEWPSEIK